MKTHVTSFLFITILIFVNSKTINAQRYVGLNFGYNAGKYFEIWKQKYSDYDSKYRINRGYQVSFYYQQVNPKNKGRFELQYGSQKTEMEVQKNQGNNQTTCNRKPFFGASFGSEKINHQWNKQDKSDG
jgi:hypothetical protein